MTTVHLLAPPNAPTTRDFALDGFSQLTIRMANVLRRLKYRVILYGADANAAPVDAFVPCVTEQERVDLSGGLYQYVPIYSGHPLWQIANARMVEEVGRRKEPRDMILTVSGTAHQPVFNAHPDLMDVEYSIGYPGSFARHRVFESHVWKHWTYGRQGLDDGRFFDDVIPCFFDVRQFPERSPQGYYLYCGRLTRRKGIDIACEAARLARVELKVIGHGDPSLVTYGTYLGAVDVDGRNELLAGATAVFCPTTFIEPFNCVAVEAQLCGTPVISTDFGGFVETVEQGRSGFRCHTLGEFVQACRAVRDLDRAEIRRYAQARYSLGAAVGAYRVYFDRLSLLWEGGWNTVPAVVN